MIRLSSVVLVTAAAIVACGGSPKTQVVQYVLQSQPGFCHSPVGNKGYICSNVRNEGSEVKPHGCFDLIGMDDKWGTSYVITVRETELVDHADSCDIERTLISVDGETDDPVGTRYTNNIGSTHGGIELRRDAANPDTFRLNGYSGPIVCEAELCDPVVGTSGSGILPVDLDFELMEVDGERVIGIVAR